MGRKITKPLYVILILLWTLLVLYPNPYRLGASLYRLAYPPVSPAIAAALLPHLDSDEPRDIERFVYQALPYRYDWEVYNVPWYFPTLEEALAREQGDCKARFLLFASLLEAKGVPHKLHISPMHLWVEYEGKVETEIEKKEQALVTRDDTGRVRFQLPRLKFAQFWEPFREAFWDLMPPLRKILLLGGPPLILSGGFLWNRKQARSHSSRD